MSGKSQNKFVVSLLLLLLSVPTHNMGQDDFLEEFTINGYSFDHQNTDYNKGIRFQGIGDYFFKSKTYAKSVPYYEKALLYIPTDADITFKLAEVYQYEKLWRLSILYYEETMSLLQQSVNFGKSQANSYISRIRIAYIYHLQGDTQQAQELVYELRKESSLLLSLYPKAWEELKIFDTIYPETAIRRQ